MKESNMIEWFTVYLRGVHSMLHKRIVLAASAILITFITLSNANAETLKYEVLMADKLKTTEGVAVCPNGKLFMSENGTGKVYEILDAGKDFKLIFDKMKKPAGLACTSNNMIIALDYAAGDVFEMSQDGKTYRVLATLKSPNGAVVAKDGTVYVSETENGRVSKILKDGKTETVVTGIVFANGLLLSKDEKTLFVASTSGGKVYSVPLSGADAGKKKVFAKGVPMVDGIAFSADGGMYACLYSAGNIAKISPDGSSVEIVATGMKTPSSPAIKGNYMYITGLNADGFVKMELPQKTK